MPSQVIAFTVSGHRQKYLRQTIDSWGRARGVQDWHLLFCLEPCRDMFPVSDFIQWLHRGFASVQVLVSDTRLGCSRNTRHALSLAFSSGAQFAVLAEEDCEVSTDVLEYFSWARDTYADDSDIAMICAHTLRTGTGTSADVVRASWFNPVVWGTWADRWKDAVRPNWSVLPDAEAWDDHLRRWVNSSGRQAVFPVQSRSLHIGEISTLLPGPLADYSYRMSLSSSFEASRPLQGYREISFADVPGLMVLADCPGMGKIKNAPDSPNDGGYEQRVPDSAKIVDATAGSNEVSPAYAFEQCAVQESGDH